MNLTRDQSHPSGSEPLGMREDIRVGMRVEAEFEGVNEEISMPGSIPRMIEGPEVGSRPGIRALEGRVAQPLMQRRKPRTTRRFDG